MILLISNYDGCVNNLYQLAGVINPDVKIVKNDEVTLKNIEIMQPSHIIISGGSVSLNNTGIVIPMVRYFSSKIPILGICLGCRAIAAAFGAKCVPMKEIVQGKKTEITIDSTSMLFQGLPDRIIAGRYHSITLDESSIPKQFEIIARACDGDIMGIQDLDHQLFGLQFHPESFMSQYGYEIMKNFLNCK